MTNKPDHDDVRWNEMTERMNRLTPEEREAYRLRCEEHQAAAEEYIRKAAALIDRQESENQM